VHHHFDMRFYLVGFMGSGKSYWGKAWSESFGLKWYDLDSEIEKAEGKTIETIFREEGELSFRKKEKRHLQTFFNRDHFILSCGGGTPCFFDNMVQMNRSGVVIYLKSTPTELSTRLRHEKEMRPLLKDVSEDQLEFFIEQKLNERKSDYQKALYHLPTRFLTNENFERILRRHQ
jgi:shikimate kinase